MSARGLIFAEVETRLAAIAGVASVERMPSGDPDAFPALVIDDGGQSIEDAEAATTRYRLRLTIEGYVVGGEGAAAHDALSDLYADVIAVLMTEPPLGGLAETISEGDMRPAVTELADRRRLAFALDIDITFPTPRGNAAVIA